MAVRSLNLQEIHQSAVKSTKTAFPLQQIVERLLRKRLPRDTLVRAGFDEPAGLEVSEDSAEKKLCAAKETIKASPPATRHALFETRAVRKMRRKSSTPAQDKEKGRGPDDGAEPSLIAKDVEEPNQRCQEREAHELLHTLHPCAWFRKKLHPTRAGRIKGSMARSSQAPQSKHRKNHKGGLAEGKPKSRTQETAPCRESQATSQKLPERTSPHSPPGEDFCKGRARAPRQNNLEDAKEIERKNKNDAADDES